MEWFAFGMAGASLSLVLFLADQVKKLENRVKELENK